MTVMAMIASTPLMVTYANSFDVTRLPNGPFDDMSKVGSNSSVYWCGAATFVRTRLNASLEQRIYVVEPLESSPG